MPPSPAHCPQDDDAQFNPLLTALTEDMTVDEIRALAKRFRRRGFRYSGALKPRRPGRRPRRPNCER